MGILSALFGTSSNSGNGGLKVGDWVEIPSEGEEGQIIEIHGSYYHVRISGGRGEVEEFKASQLKKMW